MKNQRPHTSSPVDADTTKRRRDHLRLVTDLPSVEAVTASAGRPRTIGRLIAQTAMIADTAVTRRREEREVPEGRGLTGRLLGRFR